MLVGATRVEGQVMAVLVTVPEFCKTPFVLTATLAPVLTVKVPTTLTVPESCMLPPASI